MKFKKTGDLVKAMRERNKMTQERLALDLGYSNAVSVGSIETGKAGIPPKRMLAFSKALNIPYNAIMQSMALDYMASWNNIIDEQITGANSDK